MRNPAARTAALQSRICFVLLLLASLTPSTRAVEAASDVDVVASRSPVLTVGGTRLTIQWQGPTPDVGQSALHDWILRSAQIVRGYYGSFPVRTLTIAVSATEGNSMGAGRTVGFPEPRIEVAVGRHIAASSLMEDWVMVHEMIHLSLPAVADDQNWLAEGVATYVEGIARVQAANMTEAQLWDEYVLSMPKGLPQANDRGLDRTHTWARTYWGGALYCLLADVRMHEQTGNRHGLQDALRAISESGAGMSTPWSIDRILATGDAATGTSVLAELYHDMKDQPVSPDLARLWKDLGIHQFNGRVQFGDSARLAATRRAITRVKYGHPNAGPIEQ